MEARGRTKHKLLLFEMQDEFGVVPLKMESEDVIAGATIVALDRYRPRFMLHGEISPDRARAVSDEIVGFRESFSHEKVMEQVVERFLA